MVKLQDGHIASQHQENIQNLKNDIQVLEEHDSREPGLCLLGKIPLVESETCPSSVEVEAPILNPGFNDKNVLSPVEEVGPTNIDLPVSAPLLPLQ